MSDIESLRQEAESLKNQIRVRTTHASCPSDDRLSLFSLFRMLERQHVMLLYYKSHKMSIKSVGFKCVHDERFVVILPKSMRCIGVPMQGRCSSSGILFLTPLSSSSSSRNLVSASQDGKLIVWDSYTTNKVTSDTCRCSVDGNAGGLWLGSRYPTSFVLGHDVCVRSIGQFRRLRWSWQYLFDLFVENTRRQCPR